MVSRYEKARPFLYLTVIGLAFTLPEPWAIALQASLGGFALGVWFERWMTDPGASSS